MSSGALTAAPARTEPRGSTRLVHGRLPGVGVPAVGVGLLATLTSTTTAVAAFAVVALLIALTVAAPHSRSSRPAATRSLVGAGADRR